MAGKRGSPWSKVVTATTAVLGQCLSVCVCGRGRSFLGPGYRSIKGFFPDHRDYGLFIRTENKILTSALLLSAEHRVVTKLKAKPSSSHSVRLSWKLPKLTNETVAFAILWVELDVDDAERTAAVANGSTSFTFDNLRAHRLYRFRVQTMLIEGPGGSTDKVTARPYSDKPGKSPRNVVLQYSNDSVSECVCVYRLSKAERGPQLDG